MDVLRIAARVSTWFSQPLSERPDYGTRHMIQEDTNTVGQECQTGQEIQSVVRKTPNGYCVKSEKNPDWSGGCYPTKGEAEKRSENVEYPDVSSTFSDRISSAIRILDNIRIAGSHDYLVDLNLRQLQKTNKWDKSEDKRSFYERLQELAKSGPLFSSRTLQIIEKYKIKEKNTAKWLAIQIEDGLKPPEPDELTNISDWIRDQEPDLDKLDFDEAKEASDGWHEGFKSKDHKAGPYKTKNIDLNLSDGYSMVLVPVEDLDTEGELMQHCVGSYKDQVESGVEIYSLRDSSNKPHVTIELYNDNINQIQGKQNEPPIKKYHPYIWEWAEKRDLINEYTLEFAPADVLVRMSEDSDEYVRQNVADNPNTPASVLVRMSEDPDEGVRWGVARNPNTPISVLVRMSEDSNKWVREGVALNRSTPASVLVRLAEDSNDLVRQIVAQNPNTPADVLVRMSEDSDKYVRHGVALNPNTPASVLARMSEDSDEEIRRSVAKNRSTPASVLARLAEDSDKYVRQYVAQNPNTPADILARMKKDNSI